ncbi:MAG: uroporphyrinogen-III C-methyltransferase [Gallionellaceae bacterium]|jgi:uroporphyrin-3 C-methyltransferase
MSDETGQNNPQTTAPAAEVAATAVAKHKNPVSRAISHLNLTQLTLAVVIVIFIWQWIEGKQQLNQIQNILAQRLSEADGSNKATQTLTLQSQELVRELGGKLSLLESKFAETQNQRSSLENLYQNLSSSHDQMVLAEVEQLLLIAVQQLQLSANVKSALIAMQQADSRLQRLHRPGLDGLRRVIGGDMDKLRALPDVDVSSINVRLDNLISTVDHLPLVQDLRATQDATEETATTPSDRTWQNLLREFWQEVKSLVRIENTHKAELPLLSPTQTFFLRENLKLRLMSARLALLSRDETSFKHDIKTSLEWVKIYFDVKAGEGAQVVITLQKLNAANIIIVMPDVSDSLDAVRLYRASREKDMR